MNIWFNSDIHVTYGLIPQIGKTSVADDAAQTELGDHRRPDSAEGTGAHGALTALDFLVS